MVTAIVVSGGTGSRTGQAVPKQYLTANDIPVIAYTLMNLQKVSEIDKIIVVAAEGWESFIYAYAKQFGVTKLSQVVFGGSTRNESVYNGLCALKEDEAAKPICVIDANRPLIPQWVFAEAFNLITENNVVLTAEPCYDSMYFSQDGQCVNQHIERSNLFKAQMECAQLHTFLDIYAEEATRQDTKQSASGLALIKNKPVILSKGHTKCFKITTADDFELFKAYLAAEPINNLI